MTEGQPKGIPPQERKSRREVRLEKMYAGFDLIRQMLEITHETDVDEAMDRIIQVEKDLLRKKEDRELKLLRNRALRDAGHKPREWYLYDLNYLLQPSPNGVGEKFSESDIENLHKKLPQGLNLFAQKQIYVKSEQDYAQTGERIGTSHQYWEVYVARSSMS